MTTGCARVGLRGVQGCSIFTKVYKRSEVKSQHRVSFYLSDATYVYVLHVLVYLVILANIYNPSYNYYYYYYYYAIIPTNPNPS